MAEAQADFVILGGRAVAFHGHPRATKDLDVLVRASRENANRVFRPLATWRSAQTDSIPIRATGITFDEAVEDGLSFDLDGRRIPVIGKKALVANKSAAGRPRIWRTSLRCPDSTANENR